MGYIYWIASYPKSGNTWMRAFLTALVTGDEQVDLSQLRHIAPDENMGRFYQLFMQTPIGKANNVEIARARPMAQRAMAAAAKGFLFLKTHSMVAKHLGHPTIATDVTAGAIYLIRNPLDVAVSYSEFRDREVDRTIDLMLQSGRVMDRPRLGAYEVSGSWPEHVRSWTQKPHRGLITLRYEDMLTDPKKAFGDVVAFLRMDVTGEHVDRAIELTSFETLKATEENAGFGEKPPQAKRFFRSGRTDEWRDVLTEEQVARIVTACGDQMRRFGYWQSDFDALVKHRPLRDTAAPAAEESPK